jgi:hypothetical protein
MELNKNYDTVSEAVNDLIKRGYTSDFNLHQNESCLICNKTSISLSPDEFVIDETYRFEGETDPADESIIFAISSSKYNIKGIIVNAYGIYADDEATKIVKFLSNHLKK